MATLRKGCSGGWPLAGTWQVRFWMSSQHSQTEEWLTVLKLFYRNSVVYTDYLLSFCESGILVQARPRVPT